MDLRDFLGVKMWEIAPRGIAEAELPVAVAESSSHSKRCVVRMRMPDLR